MVVINGWPNYSIDKSGVIINLNNDRKISQWLSSNGYYTVTLYKNNKRKNFKVHKLLANTFLNANNKDIDHINNNKLDNRLSNLRISNPKLNCHNVLKSNNNTNIRGVYLIQKHLISTICIDGIKYKKSFPNTIEGKQKAIMFRIIKKIENNIKV